MPAALTTVSAAAVIWRTGALWHWLAVLGGILLVAGAVFPIAQDATGPLWTVGFVSLIAFALLSRRHLPEPGADTRGVAAAAGGGGRAIVDDSIESNVARRHWDAPRASDREPGASLRGLPSLRHIIGRVCEMLGQPGGTGGIDDAFSQLFTPGIGAEIMGAGKFGHPGWHEDPEWKGAWGPNPSFHTPVFILTHHTRPSIEMEGGTTFRFIDASPAEALETAREAANGQDVRIGGGATVIREFLAAGLIDHMHIVVVPILLGRGVRL